MITPKHSYASSNILPNTNLVKFLIGVSVAILCATSVAEENSAIEAIDTDYVLGKQLYQARCISCHAGAMPKAPQMAALKLYQPERIIKSLTSGVMSTTGLSLSASEMQQVAY